MSSMLDDERNADRAFLEQLQGELSAESLNALAVHVLANGLPGLPSSSDEEYDDEEILSEENFIPPIVDSFQSRPSGHTAFSWGFGDEKMCETPPPVSLAALGHLQCNRSSACSTPRGHTAYSWPLPTEAKPLDAVITSKPPLLEKKAPAASAVATMQRLRALDAAAQCAVESTIAASAGVLELEATLPCNAVEAMASNGVVRLNGVLSANFCTAALLAVNRDLKVGIALEKETGIILTRENGYGNVLARDQRWDMYLNDQDPACHDALKALLQHYAPSNHVAADAGITATTIPKDSVTAAAAARVTTAAIATIAAAATARSSVNASNIASITSSCAAAAVGAVKPGELQQECLKEASTNSTALIDLLGTLLSGGEAHLCELSALVAHSGAPRQPLHPDTRFADTLLVAANDSDLGAACPRYTTFVALQDVDVNMGPTMVLLGTHKSADAHARFNGSASEKQAFLSECTYRHATLRQGDCMVMDSRLLHGATANVSNPPKCRALLYFTFQNPRCTNASKLDPGSLSTTVQAKLKDWAIAAAPGQ